MKKQKINSILIISLFSLGFHAHATDNEMTREELVQICTQLPAEPECNHFHLENRLGKNTRNLFELQSNSKKENSSAQISGEQASRTYARYLRSFENDIPEKFESGVTAKGSKR